jgi:hypothetical protein
LPVALQEKNSVALQAYGVSAFEVAPEAGLTGSPDSDLDGYAPCPAHHDRAFVDTVRQTVLGRPVDWKLDPDNDDDGGLVGPYYERAHRAGRRIPQGSDVTLTRLSDVVPSDVVPSDVVPSDVVPSDLGGHKVVAVVVPSLPSDVGGRSFVAVVPSGGGSAIDVLLFCEAKKGQEQG